MAVYHSVLHWTDPDALDSREKQERGSDRDCRVIDYAAAVLAGNSSLHIARGI